MSWLTCVTEWSCYCQIRIVELQLWFSFRNCEIHSYDLLVLHPFMYTNGLSLAPSNVVYRTAAVYFEFCLNSKIDITFRHVSVDDRATS